MQNAFDNLAGKKIVDPKTGNEYQIPILTREQGLAASKAKEQEQVNRYLKRLPEQFVRENSMLNEYDVLERSFGKLERVSDEFVEITKQVKQIAEDFKAGKRYNVLFQGKQGRGKTTLAACLINDVVHNSKKPTMCAIVNATKIGNLVNTYDDARAEKERKKSDFEVFIKRFKEKCDILVIDDLGKEANLQTEEREANNLIQSAWYRIADISLRKNKAVVITSNFSTAELNHMYNSATLSRLFMGARNHSITFNGERIGDYRQRTEA
ncbi:DnaA ATPase domain-containing protein [Ligilactobacillus aviarius]|uniref:AAA+ ATPase domain-containing protein n=1 Tax=Ligilactobacillus aviarius TaxID=1606 RepID=A0A510WSQ0_9LACO|nr:ATP-binding protein [Ligilactobacillus aviarius]KRM39094.1 hypothetical protein FC33_GL001503 [Ligilactobacillus aviarius subsp. aviarius DSM 20655]GEK42253.1 hypothetical protein LAV01_10850 [Ligilactobacillus aviarius]